GGGGASGGNGNSGGNPGQNGGAGGGGSQPRSAVLDVTAGDVLAITVGAGGLGGTGPGNGAPGGFSRVKNLTTGVCIGCPGASGGEFFNSDGFSSTIPGGGAPTTQGGGGNRYVNTPVSFSSGELFPPNVTFQNDGAPGAGGWPGTTISSGPAFVGPAN